MTSNTKAFPLLRELESKRQPLRHVSRADPERDWLKSGSVKVVFFEDQEFNSKGGIADFRRRVTAALAGRWLPFVQVLSPADEAQTYIFLRDAGPKYMVLVVTIEKRDASVVQVTLAPQTLAMLMQDPNEMGKAINDDATIMTIRSEENEFTATSDISRKDAQLPHRSPDGEPHFGPKTRPTSNIDRA